MIYRNGELGKRPGFLRHGCGRGRVARPAGPSYNRNGKPKGKGRTETAEQTGLSKWLTLERKGERVLLTGEVTLGIALCVAAYIAAYNIFWYADLGDTLDNAVMLVESMVSGKFIHYYAYASVHAQTTTVYPANYEIVLYLLFAIWNLPTVLLHLLGNFDYMHSITALLWCKLLPMLSLGGVAVLTYMISKRVFQGTRLQGGTAALLLLTSSIAFFPTMIALQYDCLMLLVAMLGLWYYLQRRTGWFLFWFSLAIPMKGFALLLLPPLICLAEKRPHRVLLQFTIACLPLLLCKLMFAGDFYYQMAIQSQNRDALNLLLGSGFAVGKLFVNPFILIYAGICFFCCLKRTEGRDLSYLALYVCAAVFTAFVALVSIRSYWAVLCAPFLAILISQRHDQLVPLALVETVAGFLGTVYYLGKHWIYNQVTLVNSLCLQNLPLWKKGCFRYEGFADFLQAQGLAVLLPAMYALFVGGLAIILYLTRPQAFRRTDPVKATPRCLCGVFVLRALALVTVVGALLYAGTAQQAPVIYGMQLSSPRGASPIPADPENLFTQEAIQEIQFDRDGRLTELGIWLVGQAPGRNDRSAFA